MSQAIILARGNKTIYNWKGLSLNATSVNGLRFLPNNQRETEDCAICCLIDQEKIITISRNSIHNSKLETWIVTEDK